MTLLRIISLTILFALAFTAGLYVANAAVQKWNDGNYDNGVPVKERLAGINPFATVQARDSPKDRVPENAILVSRDRVTLDIKDAQWATFTDTHSMEPVISAGANAIEVAPKSADDIKVGDIVSYKSEFAQGTIIHRVVYKGQDEQGAYFVMKGDNLPTSDPGRIRFSQLQRVVVAIVY